MLTCRFTDCTAVTRAVGAEAQSLGVDVRTGCAFKSAAAAPTGEVVVRTQQGQVCLPACRLAACFRSLTTRAQIQAGHMVNAAGLYADKVAHTLGFGQGLTLLPFKGVYLWVLCRVPHSCVWSSLTPACCLGWRADTAMFP